MAVTQNELITALQTLLSTNPVRLAMRSGTAASLDLADLVVGEIAVATDTLQVWVCTALGTVIQLTGLNLLGYYADAAALATAHPTGTAGQVYTVGTTPTHLYTWGSSAWVDLGAMNDVSTFATQANIDKITSSITVYINSTGYALTNGTDVTLPLSSVRNQVGVNLTQYGDGVIINSACKVRAHIHAWIKSASVNAANRLYFTVYQNGGIISQGIRYILAPFESFDLSTGIISATVNDTIIAKVATTGTDLSLNTDSGSAVTEMTVEIIA